MAGEERSGVAPGSCPACGMEMHGAGPCPTRPLRLDPPAAGGPCNCLPAPADDSWRPCAACGLPQAPGKAFCGFCGSRWVTAPST